MKLTCRTDTWPRVTFTVGDEQIQCHRDELERALIAIDDFLNYHPVRGVRKPFLEHELKPFKPEKPEKPEKPAKKAKKVKAKA